MDRYKYHRTYHLPESPGTASDDRFHPDHVGAFEGHDVVVTVKMDGENTTIYPDGHVHARSIDSSWHESRNWVRAIAGRIAHLIPVGWRICGENMYAEHSLSYTDLPSYFLVFGIYDENNRCLPWAETVEYAEMLGLKTVEVLYEGPWDEDIIRGFGKFDTSTQEGFVVRRAAGWDHSDGYKHNFAKYVAKFVRKGHVTTSTHWMAKKVVPNGLKG